jgi:hypothetical protein
MSDRNRANELNLIEALRDLPLQAPERSVWPELAAQLQAASVPDRRSERVRRFIVPAALAAMLLGFFVMAYRARELPEAQPATTAVHRTGTQPAATATPSAASSSLNSVNVDGHRLAALQQRSQDLESWLRKTGGMAVPLQGQDLLAATEIENLIGLVDVELAAAPEQQNTGLWQRRVDLLEDLSALRYSNSQLAAGGLTTASLTN